MEASISQKKDSMEMCQRLIPMMTEEEIRLIGLALNHTVEKLIKEGRVTKE